MVGKGEKINEPSKSHPAGPCAWPVKCGCETEVAEHYFGSCIKKALIKRQSAKARLLIRAYKVLFRTKKKHQPLYPGLYRFEAYWEMKAYRKAIRIFQAMGSPFWYADQIGRYYERCGQLGRAMVEYERSVKVYIKMKMLPLPRGPVSLFLLGRWYAKRNPQKARMYLTLYLRAGTEPTGGTNYIRYKKQAEELLKGMKGSGQ
jgi:hypothetical protein